MIGSWRSVWIATLAAERNGSKPEMRELTKTFMVSRILLVATH